VAGVGGIIYSCTNGHKITTHTNLNSFCGLGSTTVKGALVAQQIRLDKTYGNIATLNQPAEQVVYGPDDWIMNPFSVTGTPSLNPTYQSIAGLPPVL